MTNSETTIKFLAATDSETKEAILKNIADHYGISRSEVLDEILDDEAEHLLDYVTGAQRSAAHLLMKRHNLI